MTTPTAVHPLPFQPAFEQVPDDEADTVREMVAAMRDITETTYANGGHAIRSVHAKSHGLLTGQVTVLDGLPPAYARAPSPPRAAMPRC
jgi:hypothetical protein